MTRKIRLEQSVNELLEGHARLIESGVDHVVMEFNRVQSAAKLSQSLALRKYKDVADLLRYAASRLQAAKAGTHEAAEVAQGASESNQPGLVGVGHDGDAPACRECGAIMVRSGSCYRCMNCGSTSGCS